VATDSTGKVWTTDKVKFRVFLGKIYPDKIPVSSKDEFKAFAKQASVDVYRETGMSAALQTAQSFLETGYGQSVPMDKYTGRVSYNLFGIKGVGPAGAVVSNTWEVYNGVKYTIDAEFRAYNNLTESWRDHAGFLLWDSSPARYTRYAPFRAVMSDPVQGAWALRRTGYATDPDYPTKLIGIMNANGLWKLDEFEF
jgi:flagellum-specific peptidoglycan hydrolase FlgJ